MKAITAERPHSPSPAAPRSDSGRPSFVRWTQGLMNRLVSIADVALLLLAAFISGNLPFLPLTNELTALQLVVVLVLELAVFLSIMARSGGYRVENYGDPIASLLHLVGALVPAWMVSFVVMAAFTPVVLHDMGWLTAWHILQLLLLAAGRMVQRRLLTLAERRGLLRRRMVIVGANAVAGRVVESLADSQGDGEGYDVLAVFRDPSDGETSDQVGGVRVAGDLEALGAFAQAHTIDLVVIALPWSRAADILRLVESVGWIAADVAIPFEDGVFNPSFARIMPLGRGGALQVMSRPFKGTQGVMKVLEDYVVASAALLLLSPLMALAALAIRLEGPGPILFRQWRPGFGRKPFAIYKFRTMHVNPKDDARVGTTGRHDPRITKVGGILRKLSIDELPQLFNVLKGEMSVVGPRPYVADMLVGNERFSDLVTQYAERHRIKPGLTGYAQAHGMRSYALRSAENARRSIEMDLHYMTHWSLWLDVKIMVRTLLVGLAGRNVF